MAKNRENVSKKQEDVDYFKVPDNYQGPGEEDLSEDTTSPELWEELGGNELKSNDEKEE